MMRDERDMAVCYARYFPAIAAKCARMLSSREEAEDVAQETFIRLWRELDALREVRVISAWVYKTSTRLAIDRLRERKRKEPLHDGIPSGIDEERAASTRQWLAEIARVLPREDLEVLVLHRVDRLTQLEIAETLACSERQVRYLLGRAEQKLDAVKRRLEA